MLDPPIFIDTHPIFIDNPKIFFRDHLDPPKVKILRNWGAEPTPRSKNRVLGSVLGGAVQVHFLVSFHFFRLFLTIFGVLKFIFYPLFSVILIFFLYNRLILN